MKFGKKAIVIGAGIAGMATAQVLSEHFEQVTVIERDSLDGKQRNGAPQTNHVHVLLRLGVDLLEKAFPGILAEMEEGGIQPLDFARDLCWLHYGRWMPRVKSGFILYPQTRHSLESHIRRRLMALGNVSFRSATAVKGLMWSADGKSVAGVQVESKDKAGRQSLKADLVVDAGGRATQLYKWLEQAGYEGPKESRLPIDLCYVSRLFEPPAKRPDWRALWVSPDIPDVPRGGTVQFVEQDRWIVSLFGYHGDHPPHDEQGFMEFARTLRDPAFYEAIKDVRPLSPAHVYKVHDECWRHLEGIKRFPDRLLVLGDAFCYFDPVFGQGMSIALMATDFLRKRMRTVSNVAQLTGSWAKSYFRASSSWIQGVWYFVEAEALRHPQIPGERTGLVKSLQWLVTELYELNCQNPDAYLQFLKLMHLQSNPAVLLQPSISLRLAMRAAAQPWRTREAGIPHRSASVKPAP